MLYLKSRLSQNIVHSSDGKEGSGGVVGRWGGGVVGRWYREVGVGELVVV